MSRFFTVALLICLAGNFSFLYARDDSDVEQYVTKNATELWGTYLKALQKGVEGNVRIQTFYNDKLGYQYDDYVIREKKWSLDESEDPQENTSSVKSITDGYSFRISRQSDGQDWNVDLLEKTSPGTITNIKDYSFPTGEEQNWGEVQDEVLRWYILKGYSLFGNNYLPTLLRLPEFTIESAEKVNRDGVDYYRVDFSFNQPTVTVEADGEVGEMPTKYPLIAVSSGSLLLTTDYLLIKEAEVNTISYGSQTIKNDYKIVDGVPLISEYHLTKHGNGGDYRETWTFDFRIGTNNGSSRFKLSYYGLPEPNFGDSGISLVRYVILVTGLVLIGVGVWRIVRRRRETSSS